MELTEWSWDIATAEKQPEPELWAVMSLKAIGEKMRIQARKAKSQTDRETI